MAEKGEHVTSFAADDERDHDHRSLTQALSACSVLHLHQLIHRHQVIVQVEHDP
jgi:hypothetical protein